MAVKSLIIPRNYVHKVMEEAINSENKFLKKFSTNNTLDTFQKGDIVTCTYHKHNPLLKVLGQIGDKVTVTDINRNNDTINISPEFLKVEEVNKKTVKVLYDY